VTRWGTAVVSTIVAVSCRQAEQLNHADPATLPVAFEVLLSGTRESSDAGSPRIVVARTARDGRRAAGPIGIPDAAGILRSWTDYEARALIVVAVAGQRGSNLRIVEVRAPALLPQLEVTAEVESPADPERRVHSFLWAVISVPAGRIPPPTQLWCSLHVNGATARTACFHLQER
jgi:hypothetical protein